MSFYIIFGGTIRLFVLTCTVIYEVFELKAFTIPDLANNCICKTKIKLGRGGARKDREGTPPHWLHNDRISMKEFKDRESQRAAEDRWNKSTRPPGKEELDPRVYGRYDDKGKTVFRRYLIF